MQQSAVKLAGDLDAGASGMLHLSGSAGRSRQANTARLADGFPTIDDIDGHRQPVPGFGHRVSESVVCIDPETEPGESEMLKEGPCRAGDIARNFQDIDLDLLPGSYGLVFAEFSPNLLCASDAMRPVLARPEMEAVCSLGFSIEAGTFETTRYGAGRLVARCPYGSASDAQNAVVHD